MPQSPLSVTPNGLELLKNHLHLPADLSTAEYETDQPYDALLVAIDLKNLQAIQNSNLDAGSQVGIAILDPRHLNIGKPRYRIKTHNLVVGGSDSYQQEARRWFLFGDTYIVRSHQDLVSSLECRIWRKPVTRDRDIILVGHSIHRYSHALDSIGFDLCTSIVGVLDIAHIISQIGNSWLPPGSPTPKSLNNLLNTLQIPFNTLESAGNNAHFTMRALLGLVVKNYQYGASGPNLRAIHQKKLKFLDLVAYARVPPGCLTDSERKEQENMKKKRYYKNTKSKRGTQIPKTQAQVHTEREGKGKERPREVVESTGGVTIGN